VATQGLAFYLWVVDTLVGFIDVCNVVDVVDVIDVDVVDVFDVVDVGDIIVGIDVCFRKPSDVEVIV